MSIHLELPYPPSINHYYRHVGNRILISRQGRKYRKEVCSIISSQMIPKLNEWIKVRIKMYPPDRRRRDIDNIQKALLDALEHAGAYADDSQIVKLEIEKFNPVPGGMISIELEQI